MKKKLPLAARLVMGFIFFASGLAGLLNLIPPPADLPAPMMAFMAGMMATKYFFPLLKGTEVVCGLMLMSGFYVPLALIVLAPVVLNIVLLHAFVAPSGLPLALVLGGLELYLAFFAAPYKNVIRQIFVKK